MRFFKRGNAYGADDTFGGAAGWLQGAGMLSAKRFWKLSTLSSILTAIQLVASAGYYGYGLMGSFYAMIISIYGLTSAFVFGGISLCMGKGIRREGKK